MFNGKDDSEYVGLTALVSIIKPQHYFIVANAGDSQAVLVKKDIQNNFSAVPVCQVHKASLQSEL